MPETLRFKAAVFAAFLCLSLFFVFFVTSAVESRSQEESEAPESVPQDETGKEKESESTPVFHAAAKPSSPFEMQMKKGATYVGSETCAACHEAEAREFQLSPHARVSVRGEGVEVQECEMCHGPASLHVDDSGGKGTILNPAQDFETCFACHMEKKAEFNLPHHHPVVEGKMNCTACHSPHGPEVRPWSATTMDGINQACLECHQEQRGPFVWEHEGIREGCTTCHAVHGSMHGAMLVARDNNLCLRCHTQVNFPTIGLSGHAGRLAQGSCFAAGCHTAVHGSNFDDHLRY